MYARILLLSLAMVLTSCGSVKDMKKNSEDAAKNSGSAAQSAEESREEIANSRMMGRASSASTSRRNALEAMIEAETVHKKVVEAAKYFKAFEFQVWTAQKYDSPEYLQALYTSAVKEFFRDLSEAYEGKKLSKISPSPFAIRKSNRQKNVLALALTLHSVSEIQEHVSVNRIDGMDRATSMYDLIKNGLSQLNRAKKGETKLEDMNEYEFYVSTYSKEAIALLQARANMGITLVLKMVSPISEKKSNAIWLQTGFTKKYQSSFSSLNLAEQYEINEKYLKAVYGVKDFLSSIGVELKIRGDIAKVYSKMIFPEPSSEAEEKYTKKMKALFN